MISVVLTTFNRKDYLLKSVQSIINQTYHDWELIVVDDGSTDGTENFFKQHFDDHRISFYRLASNSGSTFARNYGLDRIRGDYFLVWDSDDELYPEALERLLGIFLKEQNNELAVVSAPARALHPNGKEKFFPILPEGCLKIFQIICKHLPGNEKVRLVKTTLGGDIRYKSKNVDFLFNAELTKKGKWYHLPDFLGIFNLQSDDNSLTKKRKRSNRQYSLERAPYLNDFIDDFGPMMAIYCPHIYSNYNYGAGIGSLLSGEISQARKLFKEAFVKKFNLKYFLAYIFTWIPFAKNLLSFLFFLKNKFL